MKLHETSNKIFHRTWKDKSEVWTKTKIHRMAKTILYNWKNSEVVVIPDFALWTYSKNKQTKKQNPNGVDKVQICYSIEFIEDPAIYPHTYGHMVIDKEASNNNNKKKKKTSSTTVASIPGYLHVEECTYIHIYFHSQISSPNRSKTSKYNQTHWIWLKKVLGIALNVLAKEKTFCTWHQ